MLLLAIFACCYECWKQNPLFTILLKILSHLHEAVWTIESNFNASLGLSVYSNHFSKYFLKWRPQVSKYRCKKSEIGFIFVMNPCRMAEHKAQVVNCFFL